MTKRATSSTKDGKEVDVGQRLAAARLLRGLAQAEVARRAGLAPSYLSRIENGRIQPTFPTVLRIAGVMNADVAEIVERPAPTGDTRGPCPVTRRGTCLLDLVRPEADDEHYSPREVRLLRGFASWIKSAAPDRLRAMEILLEELSSKGATAAARGSSTKTAKATRRTRR